MAPHTQILNNNENEGKYDSHYKLPADIGTDFTFERKIVWFNAIGFLALHLAALYGVFLFFYAKYQTLLWALFLAHASAWGVTIGAHRLYTHRAFKAKWPLRLALIIWQTVAGQNCLYIWVRDHRQHHKFSDTDADPHNAKRGFFFCHIGWLMSRKHPLVISKGKTIDMSDLEADNLVMFQKRYYKTLYTIFAIAIPVVVPIYFWQESYINSLFISYFARSIILINGTWCVNSVAHLYGTRPFDGRLQPVESKFVGYIGVGEGWHNYHHAFPWDYRASELGTKLNSSTWIIDACHYFGLAYDLKTASAGMVEDRSVKYGDGSHHIYGKKKIQKPKEELDANENAGEKLLKNDDTAEKKSDAMYNRVNSVKG